MHALLPLFFLLAQPFWEVRPPAKWTDREIGFLRSNSPWAQTVGPSPAVLVYLATALPIEEAELEFRLRAKTAQPQPDPDYLTYLSRHRDTHFVLAIPYAGGNAFGRPGELRRMEDESAMRVGSRTLSIVGHFPPTPADPVLRLVFPREVRATDKRVVFRLYLPGLDFPDREVEFTVKDLVYRGKLEM